MKLKLVLFALVALLAQATMAKESVAMPLPSQIKDSLPWFAVRELSDNNTPFTKTHLQQIAQKKKRVALVYFATWCIPCRVGLKQIATHIDDLTKAGTAIVLVNVGERENDKIIKFLTKLSLDKQKAVLDPFGRLTENFGIKNESENMSLPKTMVVDKALKPVLLIGEEGDDYIGLLKGEGL